jgi:NADH:ubiquinone oxidoreductase subunit K
MTVNAPRITRRRAELTVVAGLLPVGALVGGLWAWLAPPLKGVVVLAHTGERLHEFLGPESDHFFVAAFLMLGMLNVLAAVAAVLAWQWQAHRGPGMVAALCAGMVVAAGAAVGVGVLVAHLRYGTVDIAAIPLKPDELHYFTQAAPVFFGSSKLEMACTLLLPAATAALVYAVPAAATARDDLGAHPPVEAVYPRTESATAPTS